MNPTKEMTVAILAGGRATRLGDVAARVPKLMVEVAGEPFFNHQLRLLRRAGVSRIVLCVGHLGEQIVAAYGDGARWGVQLEYSFDGPRALGTGGALVRALPLLGDSFFVLYGDSYLPADYGAVARAYHAAERPALMTVYENRGAFDASNVWFEDHRIRLYSKTAQRPEMHHIDYGLSVFGAAAFSACPAGEPFDLAALQSELSQRGALAGYEVRERFHEIGSPDGLRELSQVLRRGSGPVVPAAGEITFHHSKP